MTEDIVAIQQVMADYCFRVDTASGREVAQLFTVDAVLTPVYDGDYRVVGRSDIARWFDHYNANIRANIRKLRHVSGLPLIRLDGDRATVQSYYIVDMIPEATGTPLIANGRYDDVFTKTDAGWRIAERLIEVTFTAPYAEASEVFNAMGWTG